jgi:hypothetical protein
MIIPRSTSLTSSLKPQAERRFAAEQQHSLGRDHQVADRCDLRERDDPERDRRGIRQGPEPTAALVSTSCRKPLSLRWLDEQVRLRPYVANARHEQELDHKHGRAVERDRGSLRAVGRMQCLREDAGGKRQERRCHKQQHVDAKQGCVDVLQPREQVVVGDPHASDGQEARHVGKVRRPLLQ